MPSIFFGLPWRPKPVEHLRISDEVGRFGPLFGGVDVGNHDVGLALDNVFKLTYKAADVRSPVDDVVERPGRIVIPTSTPPKSGPKRPTSSLIRRCSTGFWSPGQSEEDRRHQFVDVRRCGSREHRLRRVPLVQALIPQCKAAGKPERPSSSTRTTPTASRHSRRPCRYYVNDVNTVDQAVKANPDKLEKALAVTIPYSVGIAVPKDKPEFRDAVLCRADRSSEGRDSHGSAEEVGEPM